MKGKRLFFTLEQLGLIMDQIVKNDNLLDYLLYHPMKKWGENHVISIYRERFYSYGDYANKVKEIASFFEYSGIKKEAVIIYMDDCPACIIAFLGLVTLGAKPLIVSPKTPKDVLNKIIKIIKSRYLIKDSKMNIELEGYLIDMEFEDQLQYVFQSNGKIYEDVTEIEDDVCYLAMTSGSSGTPKIVIHSVKEMQSATYNYANGVLKITEKDTLFSIPKINFTYGLANSLFFSFALGARAILYQNVLSSSDIISLIERYDVSCFFAVPSVYSKLIREMGSKTSSLNEVRLFVSAGEYLPGELVQKWKKTTKKYIVDSVGCSETGSAYLVNMNPELKMGSAGTPVPGYKLDFYDNNDSQGMLVVSGPSNAIGYLNDKENTKSKFVDGKIHTGDWFRKDNDGYYWFLGRDDDLIKKNGRWISLNEVSDFARQQKGVLAAACFYHKEQIALVLEVNCKFEGVDKLKDSYRDNLEHYKCPDVIVLGDIPYNANGKINYLLLKRTI